MERLTQFWNYIGIGTGYRGLCIFNAVYMYLLLLTTYIVMTSSERYGGTLWVPLLLVSTLDVLRAGWNFLLITEWDFAKSMTIGEDFKRAADGGLKIGQPIAPPERGRTFIDLFRAQNLRVKLPLHAILVYSVACPNGS
jgi:hypothetical protein